VKELFEKEKVFKIGRLFYLCRYNGGFWFRLLNGYGIVGKDRIKHTALFSERYGYKKYLYIGNWKFKLLKP